MTIRVTDYLLVLQSFRDKRFLSFAEQPRCQMSLIAVSCVIASLLAACTKAGDVELVGSSSTILFVDDGSGNSAKIQQTLPGDLLIQGCLSEFTSKSCTNAILFIQVECS